MNPQGPRREGVCPRCGKSFSYRSMTAHKPFPFCSTRCREIDLGKWLTGQYVIPGRPVEDTDSHAPPPPQDKE